MFPKILRSLSPLALVAAAFNLLMPAPLVAQATSSLVTNRLTQQIDDNARITLKGTVHPLANSLNDRGAAPNSMPLDRLTLVLKRSDAQESALKQLIADMHTTGSPSYHKWLTPDQFGKQFGPSDSDLAAVQAWLQSHGFAINKVNAGRQSIEISGNVAQFRDTFHAQIHKYSVNGETHYANSTDPQIPAALTSVVSGFATLNNFRLKSNARVLGQATYNTQTHTAKPQWTYGDTSGVNFVLAPQDYAVQYDLNPLYTAGTNGTGQSIAVVNDSNINVYLVNQFRSIFNLPANPPQVIIDGNDPGVDGINNPDGPNGDSVEAYLDVEWSGAVAPNATINLVVAADTALQNGLTLALEHAIYSNVAPVVSLSFGACEANLGSFNAFLSALYEQAAAQGQTVLVSSGDSGSAGCDRSNRQFAVNGQQVSGFASTPYNVAVGGTDFFYSDYATGGASVANYWNTAPQQAPAQSIKNGVVIPEQPWNDSQYGLNIINYYTDISGSMATTIGGAGGGASNCATSTTSGTTVTCTAGYAKPSWQTGAGVPPDNVRDIPDVSLFAADGLNYTYYPVCATDGDCQPPSGTDLVQITGLGGTSASAPAFAGIMALVNQKYGPQGQANFVLYPLKAQFPAAFHDVTHGTISVPCNFSGSSPNCIAVSSPIIIGGVTEGQIGTGTTALYNAGAGYNLATGLGSVDANALVTNWGNIHFTNSSVMLTSPTAGSTFTHGSNVTFTASVAGTSPTGQVALMTDSTEDNTQAITNATLSGGTATASTTLLPGGTYHVWAHYGGDGKNNENDSAKASITVSPEASGVFLNVIAPGNGTVPSGTTNIPYGTPLVFSAQVAPSSKLSALEACFTGNSACPVYGVPTGVVTFADNGTKVNTALLNAEGDAEYNTNDQTVAVSATNAGSHSITASYAGDNSYNASSASATTYTISKAVPEMNAYLSNGSPQQGQALVITVVIDAAGVGAPPTGSVSISGAPSGTPTSATLMPGVDPNSGITVGQTFITIPATASTGTYNVTISYNGDSNYSAAPAIQGPIQIGGASSLKPTTATITPNMSSTSPKSLLSLTVTVTGQGTVAPTGNVDLQISAFDLGTFNLNPVSGTDTSTVTIAGNSAEFFQGANLITFIYSGDGTYASSTATTTISNLLSDFTLVPQSTIIPVPSSGSGPQTINLTSTNSFSGVVNLTCSGTGGVGCSFDNAAPTLNAGGNAAVKLTVNNDNVTAPGNYNVTVTGQDSTGTYIHTLALQAVVASATTLPQGLTLAGPGSLTIINPGDSATGTVTASAQGGVTGAVTFTCSVEGAPAGFSCSAPGVTITSATASTTLTVSTTSSSVPGNYVADVTAMVGSVPSNIVHVPIVLNPNAGFGLAGTNIPGPLTPGATTGNTSTITVTPAGGFTGTVNMSCSLTSSPSGAMNVPGCSIASTVSVTGTSPVTTPMTVSSTAATSGALVRPLDKFFAVGGGITVAGLLLFGIPARRRSWRAILGVLVFAAIVGMSIGCGSSGSGNNGGGGNSGTTAGTYTFTVSGSDASTGKITSSAQVTVTFN